MYLGNRKKKDEMSKFCESGPDVVTEAPHIIGISKILTIHQHSILSW